MDGIGSRVFHSKKRSRPKRKVPFETSVTSTSERIFRWTNDPSAVSGRSRGAGTFAAAAPNASPTANARA